MSSTLLIAGIDPGTTTAYAAIDLNCRIVAMDSSKDLSMNNLIRELSGKGKILLLGTDKKNIPGFVDQLRAKLGAAVIAPKYDLGVDEKRELSKLAEGKTKNTHELDALASAVFCYKQIYPLLNKIDEFLKKNRKQQLAEKVKELVIRNKIPIRIAVDLIEKPNDETAVIVNKAIERKEFSREFVVLLEKLKSQESEINLLKQQNRRLNNDNAELFKRMKKAVIAAPRSKSGEIAQKKEKTIHLLSSQVLSIENEAKLLNSAVANMQNLVILRRARSLQELSLAAKARKPFIFVDDLSILIGSKLLEEFSFVFYSRKPYNLRAKNIIDANKLGLILTENFAFIDKEDFRIETEKIDKTDMLKKVVEDYKRERSETKK